MSNKKVTFFLNMKIMHEHQTLICTLTGMFSGLTHYILFIPRTINQNPITLEVILGIILVSCIGAACSFLVTEVLKSIKKKYEKH